MLNAKKLIQFSTLYSIGNIAQSVISFFLLPIYALYLTPSDFGVVSLVTITTSLITILINSPTSNALSRFYYKSNFKKDKLKLVFLLFIFTLIQSVFFGTIFFIISKQICILILGEIKYLSLIKVYGVVIFLNPIANYFLTLLRISEKPLYFVLTNILSALTVFFSVIYLLKHNYGVYGIAIGTVINSSFIIIAIIPVYLKSSKKSFNLKLLKKPLSFSYPLILSDYSQILFESGDRYLLNILLSLKEVGIYDIGYKLTGAFNFLISKPISQSIEPMILKNEKNPNEIRTFLKKYATYYFLVGMFLALLASLFSKEIISLVMHNNTDYLEAWKIIPILLFANVIHGLGYFLGWGIIIREKSLLFSKIMIVSLLLNFALNIILIPHFGIIGAALGTLLSYIIWSILKMYYSAKYYELYFEIKRLIVIIFLSIFLYLVGAYFSRNDNYILNIISKIIVCSIYISFFVFSRFLENGEKAEIIEEIKSVVKKIKV